jgi:hypothetical protein
MKQTFLKLVLACFAFCTLTIGSLFANPAIDELESRVNEANFVFDSFVAGNYHQLDMKSSYYRNKKLRTSSGLWVLTHFHYGFDRDVLHPENPEETWDHIGKKLDEWLDADPNSTTAKIFKGMYYHRRARSYLSEERRNAAADKSQNPFQKNIKLAKQWMLENKDISKIDPHWYTVYHRILMNTQADVDELMSSVREGATRFPEYYEIYFSAAEYFTPTWSGHKRFIEDFANSTSRYVGEELKDGLYTRIYWYISQKEYGSRIFQDSEVDWNKMSRGMDEILKHYPDQWNIQNFAFFACAARDVSKTAELINMMQDADPIGAVWYDYKNLNYCVDFSSQDN